MIRRGTSRLKGADERWSQERDDNDQKEENKSSVWVLERIKHCCPSNTESEWMLRNKIPDLSNINKLSRTFQNSWNYSKRGHSLPSPHFTHSFATYLDQTWIQVNRRGGGSIIYWFSFSLMQYDYCGRPTTVINVLMAKVERANFTIELLWSTNDDTGPSPTQFSSSSSSTSSSSSSSLVNQWKLAEGLQRFFVFHLQREEYSRSRGEQRR